MEKENILLGDCLEKLKEIPDNSVDSIITDPPYGLWKEPNPVDVMKSWIEKDYHEIKWKWFMWKEWDAFVPQPIIWKECLRVLKPWWYLLAFAWTRTQDWMAMSLRFAWFEIRDIVDWVYWCLDTDTEILTKDGWKHYNKITWNNPVFCYNVDRDIFEYHLPTNYFLYENKHTAYRIQSDNTDQIISKNHRVAVEQDGRIIFKYAETLKQQENIPFLENMSEMWKTIWNTYKRTSYKEQILLWLCMKSYIREKQMKEEGYKLFVWEEMWSMLKAIYNKEEQTLKILLTEMQLNSEMKGFSEALSQVKELMDGTIQAIIQSKDVMTELQVLEELRNSYKEEMKICKSDDKICKMSDWVYWDGEKGLICDGTQIKSCDGDMKTIDKNWVCSSYKSQCRGQQNWEPNVIQDELRTQELWELKRYKTTLATITEIEYNWYVWCVEVPTWCFVARRNWKIFITWNSWFPKSLNIWKKVDQIQGNEREEYEYEHPQRQNRSYQPNWNPFNFDKEKVKEKQFKTKGTSKWEWWWTALKPAIEPITMARKPLEKWLNVAENCLKWGTGGINIEESRVGTEVMQTGGGQGASSMQKKSLTEGIRPYLDGLPYLKKTNRIIENKTGRFPANLIHDNSEEVRECFPSARSAGKYEQNNNRGNNIFGSRTKNVSQYNLYNDSGNASRFFKSIIYQAKASKSERNKGMPEWQTNGHCTVKPVALMEYLINMVSREWQVILDPFAGSGTTWVAAKKLKRKFIWIEKNEEYFEILKARIKAVKI